MSIQTEITRLNTAKTNILNSIKNKGVDTSSVSTLSDVSPLIDNIKTGITPSGSLDITENGSYDVTNYASANVNVASSGGGKWQGFGATIYGSYSDGGFMTELLSLPVEVGKTYEITLGYEGLTTSTITFTTECVSNDLGTVLDSQNGTNFMYYKEWEMASFGGDYGVVMDEVNGIGIVAFSIKEV